MSKCEVKGCKNEAKYFIRTKFVCEKCYKILKRDNKRRIKANKKIPKNFKLFNSGSRNHMKVNEEDLIKMGELDYTKLK